MILSPHKHSTSVPVSVKMCITFLHVDSDPGAAYKLVLAMNRDEFSKRPTQPACWRSGLLGGWDLQPGREGGTWLAIDRRGRLGFLTNIFTGGVVDPKAQGRGFLVVDWLGGKLTAEEYLAGLAEDEKSYNPFNLVLLERDSAGLYSVSRYTRGLPGHTDNFGPLTQSQGTFGVGNHPQHQPYNKSVWGTKRLAELVQHTRKEEELVLELERMMTDCSPHWPDPQIARQSSCHGQVGPFKQFGEQLSSVFVDLSEMGYKTRTTTFVLVDNKDTVTFIEKNHIENRTVNRFQFKCDSEEIAGK